MSAPNTFVFGKTGALGLHPRLLLLTMTKMVMTLTLMMTSQRDVITVSAMLPYGNGTADSGHVGSSSTSLPSAFTLYGNAYSTVYVNEDGFVDFTGGLSIFSIRDTLWANQAFPVVCIFCTDLVPVLDHMVWTRLSTDQSDVQAIETLARQYAIFGNTFTPDWVFVVTWDDLISRKNNTGNILQLVLASDGHTSLVLMEFHKLTWIEGFDLGIFGFPYTTKVGIGSGDGSSYVFQESASEDLFNLTNTSNIDVPGQYLFRVDQATITATPGTPVTTTITTIATTTATTTADDTTHAALSSPGDFNADPYYIGFGASGALVLILSMVAVVLYKTKSSRTVAASRPTSSKPSVGVRVEPAPLARDFNNSQRPPAATSGVLFLDRPFRIPRPTASLETV